jgi:hypothetical protein
METFLQNCDLDSIQRSLFDYMSSHFLRVIFNNGITILMKSDNIGANIQYIHIFYEMI